MTKGTWVKYVGKSCAALSGVGGEIVSVSDDGLRAKVHWNIGTFGIVKVSDLKAVS